MKAGKLPSDLLARLLARLPEDPRLLLGPGIGRDAAAIDMGGGRVLVAKADPVTFATKQIGRYVVHVNANDVACLGARPAWFMATVLLPEGATAELAEEIFEQIRSACDELGVTPVGGHTEIVAHLLDSGAQVPHPEEMHTGETSLVIAQTRGYDEIVRLLSAALDRGAPVLPQGVTIPESQDLDQWREFLTADPARIRIRGTEGNTALHGAVARRNREFMAFLLDRGAEIDAVRDDGLRPIHLAIYRNMHWITHRSDQSDRADLVRDLIAKGADYTITVAAAIGDVDRVRALLSQDPSLVNDPDTCRKRPLSCAAERGDIRMIEMLLAHGADLDLPEGMCGGDGYALLGAVDHDHLQCARLLLKRGANPNAELDSSGNVYARCKNEKARQLVLSYGGRVNIITHVMREEVDVVQRLLEEDPSLAGDIFYVHHDITGPVHEANFIKMFQTAFGYGANPAKCPAYVFRRALTDMPPVAEFLMDHGVSPNLAVHDVAQKGRIAAMELLIRKGADLEMRDEQYEATPLACAVRAGQLDMVKFLLSKGAKTRYPGDKAWSTPEFWAERNGHKEIVEILRARSKAWCSMTRGMMGAMAKRSAAMLSWSQHVGHGTPDRVAPIISRVTKHQGSVFRPLQNWVSSLSCPDSREMYPIHSPFGEERAPESFSGESPFMIGFACP
ncbi:MAG: ankyrin repeat domain-containing protein [Planctomycetes bacterium]|nr:ankyrin repeat domain-containing protein [Planctomycetota bacterium]